ERRVAGVAGAVQRAVGQVRFEADVFHDVDLAALRPADVAEIVAQHPERRPDALGLRQPDARLDAAMAELALAARDHARGAVLAGAVPATGAGRRTAPRLDHQHVAAGHRVVLDEGVLSV